MTEFNLGNLRHLMSGLVGGVLVAVFFLLIIVVSYFISTQRFDPDKHSLRPDFIERILCPDHSAPSDEFWEHAFTQLGFRPLNPPAIARRYGIDYPASGQTIWGLDGADHILEVYMPSSPYGDISISLTSAPPTTHDVQLEAMIRSMVDEAHCNVATIRGFENKSEAQPVFLKMLKDVKGWYAEADAMERRQMHQ